MIKLNLLFNEVKFNKDREIRCTFFRVIHKDLNMCVSRRIMTWRGFRTRGY